MDKAYDCFRVVYDLTRDAEVEQLMEKTHARIN